MCFGVLNPSVERSFNLFFLTSSSVGCGSSVVALALEALGRSIRHDIVTIIFAITGAGGMAVSGIIGVAYLIFSCIAQMTGRVHIVQEVPQNYTFGRV